MRLICLLIVLAWPLLVPAEVPSGSYSLDQTHASLIFRVNHLGFSLYTARFLDFDAQLDFNASDLAASGVSVTVEAGSIETDFPNPEVVDFNAMLRGADWLDADNHPEIRWASSEIRMLDDSSAEISGELTLRGVTRPVTLTARYNGGYTGHPMDPNARIGFSAHGTFNRSAFGMTYGIPEPGTTMGVGDKVEVIIEAEFSGPPLEMPADS